MARHVGLMLERQRQGAVLFDYGNTLREMARKGGEKTPTIIMDLFLSLSARSFAMVKDLFGGLLFRVIRKISGLLITH